MRNTDTHALAAELRQHGIKLLGSTIVGLEHHTPQNIRQEIEYAVAHGTDFHQFMLYTPVPGTPLFQQMQEEGRMLEDIDLADIHGQYKFNFEHAAISRDESKRCSIGRFASTSSATDRACFASATPSFRAGSAITIILMLRVRQRIANEAAKLRTTYDAALWAMEKRLQKTNADIAEDSRTAM